MAATSSPSTILSQIYSQIHPTARAIYPDGVLSILALLGLGASDSLLKVAFDLFGGDDGMITFVRRIKQLDASPEIRSENGIFFTDKVTWISTTYAHQVASLAAIFKLDFKDPAAIQQINAWIQTRTSFSNVLAGDLRQAVMVLVNTLWFKDTWVHKFSADRTRPEEFHLSSGETTSLPTMNQWNKKIEFYQDATVQGVRLPFTNGAVAELVMGLPAESAIEHSYPYANPSSTEVRLYVPKFQHEETIDLEPLLRAGNFNGLFEPGHFGRMVTPDLVPLTYVSKFLQRIFVSLDEDGAEVRAATVGLVAQRAIVMPPSFIEIRFNRPFHYRILKGDSTLVQGYFTGSK